MAMRRALVLAARGLGSTSPNPVVGCVILDPSGEPVGEGYHQRAGGPHA
ncbi:MAG TPA: riboflavin biosynthesis protein RibD, partial [Streptomyces sp.]|nr:riboflavin biosynthesis protein RibD [Streptomyces sp.]